MQEQPLLIFSQAFTPQGGTQEIARVAFPIALRQVLLPLLDNALVHTAPGTAIRLTGAPDGDRVAICVRDTGPGIPLETLPHIFERLYQGDIARTGNGSGLGLAIVRELVEAQGGAITVESQPGKRAAFTIRLPMVAEE